MKEELTSITTQICFYRQREHVTSSGKPLRLLWFMRNFSFDMIRRVQLAVVVLELLAKHFAVPGRFNLVYAKHKLSFAGSGKNPGFEKFLIERYINLEEVVFCASL